MCTAGLAREVQVRMDSRKRKGKCKKVALLVLFPLIAKVTVDELNTPFDNITTFLIVQGGWKVDRTCNFDKPVISC